MAAPDGAALQVLSPLPGATVGNGNLVSIEIQTSAPLDGISGWVEVAASELGAWQPARLVPDQPLRWRYLWPDPSSGPQNVRVRAVSAPESRIVETSVAVNVDPTAASGIRDPYASPGGFYKGQLHDHSTWSFDGWTSMPPRQLAEEYRRLGFDWLAITDHNVVANPSELNNGAFAVIPGYESTTETGHIVGLFTDTAVDFNLPPQARIDAITAAGGLAILAHPGWTVGWTETQVENLHGYTALEIFNGVTTSSPERIQRSLTKWHRELRARGREHPVWAVAVDDAHQPSAMNRGWVMAKLPTVTPATIKAALQRGAFYASNGPSFSAIGVLDGAIAASSRNARTIRFIDQNMKVVAEGPPALATYRPNGQELFIRIEAVAGDGATAWSQPFFIG